MTGSGKTAADRDGEAARVQQADPKVQEAKKAKSRQDVAGPGSHSEESTTNEKSRQATRERHDRS
jgi:hypothetical protein